ncbi:MAG: hypothetical protein ACTSWA_13615 [Candidatus Thorarchaeota archaeon]
MEEWDKFQNEVARCLKKNAKKELGIKIGDKISKEQSIDLTRLRFRCYYERLGKVGVRRFSRLIEELIESITKPSEVLGERQFKYDSKFQDPRDVLEQNEFLVKISKVIFSEIDDALFSEDTRLISRMFILSYIGNIINRVYLGFLEPLIDLLNLANHTLQLDADWATALVAVSLEEALVKKKLRELGYEPKKKEGFHKQVEKLVELLKEENIRPSMDVLLTDGFRNIRHEIIHDPERWKPKEEEVNEITRHTIDLAKALWPDLFKIEDEKEDE